MKLTITYSTRASELSRLHVDGFMPIIIWLKVCRLLAMCRPLIKIYMILLLHEIWVLSVCVCITRSARYWAIGYIDFALTITNRPFVIHAAPSVRSFIRIIYRSQYILCANFCINSNGWVNGKLLFMSSMPFNFRFIVQFTLNRTHSNSCRFNSASFFLFLCFNCTHMQCMSYTLFYDFKSLFACYRLWIRKKHTHTRGNVDKNGDNCAMTLCKRNN